MKMVRRAGRTALLAAAVVVPCGNQIGIDPLAAGPYQQNRLVWDRRTHAPQIAHQPQVPGRNGIVRLEGHAFADDKGPYLAIGATLFWALWAEGTNDAERARLDANLRFLANHGVDYVRILGEVGGAYWRQREINPRRATYETELTRLIDRVASFGMRTEITIFGGLDFSTNHSEREETVRKVVGAIKGREHLVQHVEIGNESWQTGFDGLGSWYGEEVRRLAHYFSDYSAQQGVKPVLLSLTSPLAVPTNDSLHQLYSGSVATLATIHFHRQTTGVPDGSWRFVRQAWLDGDPFSNGAYQAFTSNEPMGPMSSVSTEESPVRLAAAAGVAWLSGGAGYVFHSHAGIVGGGPEGRGMSNIFDHPSARHALEAIRTLKAQLPSDLPNWQRVDHGSGVHPFHGSMSAQLWPEGAQSGAVRLFAACSGARCVTLPIGMKGRLRLIAGRKMSITVKEPTSGAEISQHVLDRGDVIVLPGDDDPFDDRNDFFLVETTNR